MMGELDYLIVLRALAEIPFGVGRRLLMDFLQGDEHNPSIVKNRLSELGSFGMLGYDDDELTEMIESLVLNNLIRQGTVPGNKYWKVYELTDKGREEIVAPTLHKKRLAHGFTHTETIINEENKQDFSLFSEFLKPYNDEQKKAIVDRASHILCIAGAGSGKTTVLTKRIEHLVKHRKVSPKDILAITFTRKARQEMRNRLDLQENMQGVMVETFNSFSEKVLRYNNDLVYSKPVRVVSYRDKLVMISKALQSLNLDMEQAIRVYFTQSQRKSKPKEQLAAIFLNDCFFVRDYFKFKARPMDRASFVDYEHQEAADLVYGIVNYIEGFMLKHGLRDFADQLIDTIGLYENRPDLIPEFSHVLVDEYQDVNSTQIRLIEQLNPKNLFAVGDPRQSIFGWRGSDIKYILNFEERYPEAELITLTRNYRSKQNIVKLVNFSIKHMKLPDLISASVGEGRLKLIGFGSEDAEAEFVIQTILATEIPPEEIFVLARTNRQLNELSLKLKLREIPHIVRSDEQRKKVVAGAGDVTLATVHAIKGMEAKLVIVIGCTGANFPCKGSEHPVVEMVKVDEYDKEEEERRLFYVAMSRAKECLILSHSGKKPTYFISNEMAEIIEGKQKFNLVSASNVMSRLKTWRKAKAKALGIPPYMVLHDRTLTDLSVRMPLTLAELETVSGLGPTKLLKFGEELLDIISGAHA
jgi:superfamily I DNA/RNA helicase/DNA-binding MarR family transcriptional regulator